LALIFVTGNRHKFEEAKEVAARYGVELEMRNVALREIQSDDLTEIARWSAAQACGAVGKSVLVEDAGLFIQALRGFPGPYSSFVFRAIGNGGVLKLMRGVSDRRAEFRSAVGYCKPGSRPVIFEGIVKGAIASAARGSRGFGFDPIFLPKGSRRTFGEMSTAEKNKFSHRAKAMKKFVNYSALKGEASGVEQ